MDLNQNLAYINAFHTRSAKTEWAKNTRPYLELCNSRMWWHMGRRNSIYQNVQLLIRSRMAVRLTFRISPYLNVLCICLWIRLFTTKVVHTYIHTIATILLQTYHSIQVHVWRSVIIYNSLKVYTNVSEVNGNSICLPCTVYSIAVLFSSRSGTPSIASWLIGIQRRNRTLFRLSASRIS